MEKIGVVGAGLMGSGITTVCLMAGFDVVVVDEAPEAAEAKITSSLRRAGKTRGLAPEAVEELAGRVKVGTDLGTFHDRDLVIEAIVEAEAQKVALFSELDRIVARPDAILASNTSAIPIMKLAMATSRPEKVIGMHFFNPPPVRRLLELVPTLLTDQDTIDRATELAAGPLDREVICAKDRAGFVVNALLVPYLLSAVRMLESGFATAADIDTGMTIGCAHPLGPLALTDLIGLDTTLAIAESLYTEFKEPTQAPPPLLRRMVDAGLLGRKSGRGFYQYGDAVAK